MTDSSRRIVLCALLIGIGVMLAASVAWRLDGKPLVHEHAPAAHRPPSPLGAVPGGQGKWQDAAEQLERSVALKDDASARYSLGVIWRYHLKDEAKARAHFDTAAKISNDPALASMIKAELDKAAEAK